VDTVELVRDITYKMCDRDFDLDLVQETFADDFVHHANGTTSDKAAYLARGREYRAAFSSIDRPSSTSSSPPATTAWSPRTRCSCTAATAEPTGSP
jgi:hypothetical protein